MKKSWAEPYMKLSPVTDYQLRYHWEHTAKYIFVHDKNGSATCSRCGKELHLGKTKHKQDIECPECKAKMNVQHEWRMSKSVEIINWMVIPKVVDDTLVLRYVLARQVMNKEPFVGEVARMVINENHVDAEFFTFCQGKWIKGKGNYFRTPCYMMPNRYFCLEAYEYPRNFFKEIDKMSCFKYYSAQKEYSFRSYSSQLQYQVRSARLNEKLYKVGLKGLADYHRNYFINHNDRCYDQNYKATSLMGMLKLDKPKFDILKKHDSYSMLAFLQSEKNFNVRNFEFVGGSITKYKNANEVVNKTSISFTKIASYLDDKNYYEYSHYLSNLEKLGYNLSDIYYVLPKDFKAADAKITREYMEMFEKEKLEKAKAKDVLIKKISDGIKEMPNLKEFLGGSNGLLVYVPESSRDLIEEGATLHNCLGTYVDRVAEGKTLVFFVRKLDNPTAPFVAFEYHNGTVVQCRYDHNEPVKDTEIISFVNRFAEALKAA